MMDLIIREASSLISSLSNERKKLREPVQDKLFFAGEVTSTHHYSTVPGVYWSGIDAARRAIETMNEDDVTV